MTFTIIIFTSGSFWTSILAYCAFREPIFPIEIVGMVICFAGMVTITLSGTANADSEDEIEEADADVQSFSKEQLILGYALIFIQSWIFASNCVLNRALKPIHHAIVMFWHGTFGMTLAVLGVLGQALMTEGPIRFFQYEGRMYGLLLSAMFFDSIGVTSITIAF